MKWPDGTDCSEKTETSRSLLKRTVLAITSARTRTSSDPGSPRPSASRASRVASSISGTTPDYLDNDDDNDTIPTRYESPDPNVMGILKTRKTPTGQRSLQPDERLCPTISIRDDDGDTIPQVKSLPIQMEMESPMTRLIQMGI